MFYMPQGSTLRQYAAAGASTISVTMTGICFVWLEPLTTKLIGPDSEIPGLTSSDISWLVSSIEIGELVATVPAALLADRYGRKPIILGAGPVCLLSSILILTTRNLPVLYLIRIIQGVALAIPYTVVPMYIAEITEPRIRGEITGQFMTFWYLGITYNYIIGPIFEYQVYTYLCSILPIIFILVFAWMPESPYYLLMVDKPERARKALQWFRNSNEVDEEFKSISSSVENDMKNKGTWKDLVATKKDRKALFIVQLVGCLKFLSGVSAMVAYATDTFAKASSEYSYMLTVMFGMLLVIISFSSALISDTVGRRKLLLWSIVGSVFSNMLVAAYFFVVEMTSIDVTAYYWVLLLAVGVLCISANFGVGPLLLTMQAEYFPSNTRGLAGGVTGMTASVTTFVNLKAYQMLTDTFGIYMNFVTYVVISSIGFVFIYRMVTETACKSLGEIQVGFAQEEIQVQEKELSDRTNGVSDVKDAKLENF